jgi:hypothetical protein
MNGYSNPLSPEPDKMHLIGVEPVGYEDGKIIAEAYMGIYTCWDESVDSYQTAISRLEAEERILKAHISGDIKRQLLIQTKHQPGIFTPSDLYQLKKSSTVGFKWLITGTLNELLSSISGYSGEFMDEQIQLMVQIKSCYLTIDRKEDVKEQEAKQKQKKDKWINKLIR